MGSVSLIRDFDGAVRRRIELLSTPDRPFATVIQDLRSPCNGLIRALLDKDALVSLYMLDPIHAGAEDSELAWDCALNVIPNFAGHAQGSLDVWLSDAPVPFNAVWVEGAFIAAGPRIEAAACRDANGGKGVVPKGIIIADAGTAEYSTLTEILATCTDAFVGSSLAFVISRGSVRRAMGDH